MCTETSLEKQCNELSDHILELCCYYEEGNKVKNLVLATLEDFAKEQRIMGLEAVLELLKSCDGDIDFLKFKIDAEIKKLTEGG